MQKQSDLIIECKFISHLPSSLMAHISVYHQWRRWWLFLRHQRPTSFNDQAPLTRRFYKSLYGVLLLLLLARRSDNELFYYLEIRIIFCSLFAASPVRPPVPFSAQHIIITNLFCESFLLIVPSNKYLKCCKYQDDKITIILGVPLPLSLCHRFFSWQSIWKLIPIITSL